ncbi:MAG: hypothetical protein VW235_03265, partial [Rhodospirillaceae bacterium]
PPNKATSIILFMAQPDYFLALHTIYLKALNIILKPFDRPKLTQHFTKYYRPLFIHVAVLSNH